MRTHADFASLRIDFALLVHLHFNILSCYYTVLCAIIKTDKYKQCALYQ